MSKHVVIVGAGVIGLSTAYYCARRGFQVTVIERKGAQRDGTSYGNAGMVVPSHFIPLAAPGMVALGLKWMWNPASPFYIKPRFDAALLDWGHKFWRAATPGHVQRSAPLIRDLSFASRACFEEFAALPGANFDFVTKGLLMLCQTEHALHEEGKTAEQARALGVPVEVLDAKQTAALDPGATMKIAGSVYFPKDCHLSPAKFMGLLQSELEKLGAKFVWDRDVVDWQIEAGNTIRAVKVGTSRCDVQTAQRAVPTQLIEGDEFVLCGGSWSPQLAEKLALNIPMQAGKGYSLTLENPRFRVTKPFILKERRVAVTPMGDTLRFGGTMEIAGHNDRVRPERVEQIIAAASAYMPEFTAADFAGVRPWFGYRPVSPDGLPYIGRFRRYRNLTTACGHAMLGVTLAPGAGRLVAEVICERKPSVDLTLLNPDRYA